MTYTLLPSGDTATPSGSVPVVTVAGDMGVRAPFGPTEYWASWLPKGAN